MLKELSERERAAGILVVAAVVVVAVFVVGAAVVNRWFEPRTSYHLRLNRADGLRPGSPVLLAGVEIGVVGELGFSDDDRVDAELVVWRRFAPRITEGTTAVVHRVLAIGDKRVTLSVGGGGLPLPPGAVIPATEPVDLVEAVSTLDVGATFASLERAVSALELVAASLGEPESVERVMATLEGMGPTLERMGEQMDELNAGLGAVFGDPDFRRAYVGLGDVVHDPATRRAFAGMATAFEAERVQRIEARLEAVLERSELLLAPGGPVEAAFEGTGRLAADPRVERLLEAGEKLADAEQLGRLAENLAVVAEEMARSSPEMRELVRELGATLDEAVVVLRALQRSWLLEKAAREVREEGSSDPP